MIFTHTNESSRLATLFSLKHQLKCLIYRVFIGGVQMHTVGVFTFSHCINPTYITDPTSGSGSLLINIGQSVSKRIENKNNIKHYAQELKENTYNLTRMNLVMRGILAENIITRNGDTLEEDWPYFEENDLKDSYKPLYVDAVVSNPPYSQKWDPEDKETDPRYSRFGLAPKSKADYAFLLHDLYHIKPDGIMCVVLPHGVLFRGNEEGYIRRNLNRRKSY